MKLVMFPPGPRVRTLCRHVLETRRILSDVIRNGRVCPSTTADELSRTRRQSHRNQQRQYCLVGDHRAVEASRGCAEVTSALIGVLPPLDQPQTSIVAVSTMRQLHASTKSHNSRSSAWRGYACIRSVASQSTCPARRDLDVTLAFSDRTQENLAVRAFRTC
jgi:hypothetical protein